MTDLVPKDRLDFYNRFGGEISASGAEAIDEAVESLTGLRGGEALRAEVTEIIRRMWVGSAPDYSTPALETAVVMIGRAIERSTNVQPLTQDLKAFIELELRRVHRDLLEGMVNFYRDLLIDLGKPTDT